MSGKTAYGREIFLNKTSIIWILWHYGKSLLWKSSSTSNLGWVQSEKWHVLQKPPFFWGRCSSHCPSCSTFRWMICGWKQQKLLQQSGPDGKCHIGNTNWDRWERGKTCLKEKMINPSQNHMQKYFKNSGFDLWSKEDMQSIGSLQCCCPWFRDQCYLVSYH